MCSRDEGILHFVCVQGWGYFTFCMCPGIRVFYILYVFQGYEGILHFVCVPGMRVFYILYVSRDEGILHFVFVPGMRVFYILYVFQG